MACDYALAASSAHVLLGLVSVCVAKPQRRSVTTVYMFRYDQLWLIAPSLWAQGTNAHRVLPSALPSALPSVLPSALPSVLF